MTSQTERREFATYHSSVMTGSEQVEGRVCSHNPEPVMISSKRLQACSKKDNNHEITMELQNFISHGSIFHAAITSKLRRKVSRDRNIIRIVKE